MWGKTSHALFTLDLAFPAAVAQLSFGRKPDKPEPYKMFVASLHSLMFAAFLGGWEMVLILAVLLILLGAKRFPGTMRGLGDGMSAFRKSLDRQGQDAGKSAGGIFGKPAAEALTPENQTGELYDPAVFRRDRNKRSFRQLFRDLWPNILKFLRIKY